MCTKIGALGALAYSLTTATSFAQNEEETSANKARSTANNTATTFLSLPAQPLADSLRAVAGQTNSNIIFDRNLVAGLSAKPLSAGLSMSEALNELLGSTGLLTYCKSDEKTVVIVPIKSQHACAVRISGEALDRAGATTEGTFPDANGRPQRGAASQRQDNEHSTRDPYLIEEVIVTAQKRGEQYLHDVPISISVLSGEVLDSSTFTSMGDALRSVSGLGLLEQGQSGMTKVAIRGVSSNSSLFNSSSVVGYYLDEIPFAFVRFPLTPDTDVYDLERVEVLRGPQGTLYGASSLNGVVRILTRDADLNDSEFKVRTALSSTRDGGESYRGDAALSVPLIPGRLAVRGVAGYADNSGWIDQPISAKADINESLQKNYRVKVNAVLAERWSTELLAWFSRNDRNAGTNSRDDRTSPAGFPTGSESEYDAYGLTLTYEHSAVSILSATNYLQFSTFALGNFPVGSPSLLDTSVTRLGAELIAQEFRLASKAAGPWHWSAGAIYRDEKDSHYFVFESRTPPPGLADVDRNRYRSRSFALFSEVARTLFNERWELTAGVRYFEDETSSNELSSLTGAAPFGLREDSFDAVTSRAIMSYRPEQNRNYYVSYAEGFRSGFAQHGAVLRVSQGVAPAVRPDFLHNFEIGTKGRTDNRRLTYDLSLYYIDWKDTVQVLTSNVGGATVNAALNSEGVDGPGIDAAATLQLTNRLNVTTTVSWNDLGFAHDVVSANGSVLYPQGGRPPQSSETTASVAIDYSMALPRQYSARFSGSVNYLSKMLTPAATTAASLAGDNLLVARSAFTFIAPTGWSAMLFVDNLTDENGRIQPAPPADPLAGADRLRPRTVGVQLDYRF